MGYIRHHAIVVTGTWVEARALRAIVYNILSDQDGPEIVYLPVSSLMESQVNGHVSFVVGPDGSNEFKDASAIGNALRDRIIRALRDSRTSWTEVQYGDDEGQNIVLRTNAKPKLDEED